MELFERDLWPECISDLRIAPNLIHKRVQLSPISFHLGQLVLHLCYEEDLYEMMWFVALIVGQRVLPGLAPCEAFSIKSRTNW